MGTLERKNFFSPERVLEHVSSFQLPAQRIRRYEGNPYVQGDSIAEHIARAVRMLIYVAPQLKKEFPAEPSLIEDTLVALIVHDDDEIIDGYDIPTSEKVHNANDEEEIGKFTAAVADLGEESATFVIHAFSAFRRKSTLAARIAKVLDNITGNQLVIEQKVGLVNPDQARFGLEYLEKVKGVSRTTDALIDAQITQIITIRESLRHSPEFLTHLPPDAVTLLEIDIRSHTLDRSKVNMSLEQLVGVKSTV